MRTHQLALLPTCALSGCRQAVTTVGEPCSDCQRAFGAMLRHQSHGQPLTAAEIDARDNHVRQAYQHQRNQITGRNDPPPQPNLLAVHRTSHLHPNQRWLGNATTAKPSSDSAESSP